MTIKSKVFISYSRKDSDIATRLHTALEAAGQDAWIDWVDIPKSAKWMKEIQAGIESADTFVFVISPDSIKSEVCLEEVEYAIKHHKRIIPIVWQEPAEGEPSSEISALNWIFFRENDDFNQAFRELNDAIETDLEWVAVHTRLLIRAREWEDNQRNKSFTLQRDDLKSAETWLATSAEKEPKPTELQTEYILNSRKDTNRRQRNQLIGASIALIISVVLGIMAYLNGQEAERRFQEALAGQLAAMSTTFQETNFDPAVLLAIEGYNTKNSYSSLNSLLRTLQYNPKLKQHLSGHTSQALSVAFSPDGRILASGSYDGKIWLWEVENGQPIVEPLIGHNRSVYSLAFSPDGRVLASGACAELDAEQVCEQGEIRLWDVASGQPLGETMLAHAGAYVEELGFSPDGHTLISGGTDASVSTWAVDSLQFSGDILPAMIFWGSLDFSQDGRLMAIGDSDGTIELWDLETGERVGEAITGHSDWIVGLALSPDGRVVASGACSKFNEEYQCVQGEIRLWDMESGQPIGGILEGNFGWVSSLAFDPNGGILASGACEQLYISNLCVRGEIRLWDVETGQLLEVISNAHTSFIESLVFSPIGRYLASSSDDQTVRVWDLEAGELLGEPLIGHSGEVRSLAISPDGRTLAIGSGGSDLTMLWDVENRQPLRELLTEETLWISSLAFSSNGRILASGNSDDTIHFWDVATGELLREPLVGHKGQIYSVAFSPDGRVLASGSADENIRLWDVETGLPLGEPFTGYHSKVNSVAFSPDGRILASGSCTDKIIDFECAQGEIRIWDVENGQLLVDPLLDHNASVLSVAFSPDGTILASSDFDGEIRLWDVDTWLQKGKALSGPILGVNSVAFSLEGRTLASGGNDGTIQLWDVDTGQPLGEPLIGHTGRVYSVVYSPDSSVLISGGEFDEIIFWDVDPEIWKEKACQRINRNFTQLEWQTYLINVDYRITCRDNYLPEDVPLEVVD